MGVWLNECASVCVCVYMDVWMLALGEVDDVNSCKGWNNV